MVRDWSYPYDADYGWLGGERILDKRLEVHIAWYLIWVICLTAKIFPLNKMLNLEALGATKTNYHFHTIFINDNSSLSLEVVILIWIGINTTCVSAFGAYTFPIV